MSPMKHIDIMLLNGSGGGKFYMTLHYRCHQFWKDPKDEIMDYVLSRCPSLRNRDFVLYIN